ncbi:MAG: carbamoyl-phosphate synthase small subunit, partial [Methylotenera sp.]
MSKTIPAVLVLADGTVFKGISIGASGHTVGEVVFNTAMTGYQEILTDPSYTQQIVTLTYPHIGNTGANPEDVESNKVYAAGLIIRDSPLLTSNFRSTQTLSEYLIANNVVAIADIDTRKLTRILREKGAQAGCIMAGENVHQEFELKKALSLAKDFPGLAGMDLAKVVSCKTAYEFTDGEWALGKGFTKPENAKFHVVAFDYGVKQNILRMLVSRGCKVTVLPAESSAEQALSYKPDGIFLSNGPGDPEPCDYAIKAIKTLVDSGIPTFGICLGHQLLALASGAKTMKMKFGHHGANH